MKARILSRVLSSVDDSLGCMEDKIERLEDKLTESSK